jgi:hypothetical protein
VSDQTFHRWRNQYGGMKAEEARRLRQLEEESNRLKNLLADAEPYPDTAGHIVLDQLENRSKRRFRRHWAFVRYAKENGLSLDFKTPPKRPGRTLAWPEETGKP